jgi:hypothetical protein
MPRAEMLSRISSAELSEWIAFANLEPFGTEIGFLGHAIVASTIANVNRGKNKKTYKPEDFMPQFESKRQTVDEMLQFASMMTVGLGGKDLRKEEE